MIIVKLQGGLGNQLFQYAAGRAVADFHYTSLAFDFSFLNKRDSGSAHTSRDFGLSAFGISPLAPSLLAQLPLGSIPFAGSRKLAPLLRILSGLSVYKENSLQFNQDIFKKTSPFSYLTGFFQSEKYFIHLESQLRSELQFSLPTKSKDIDVIKSQTCSVSLHVRRGDYVNNLLTNQFHGTCSMDYYSDAIQYIAQRKQEIHLFVFSDEPDWVKENMKFPFPTTFMNGTEAEDMQLMSLCNHHIIANSSFSWWGAWLNPSKEKIVVAPKRWFADEKAESQSFDIVPGKWIKI